MEFEKNFACTFTGCDMTFTTQEELTVHKRKHLMLLNFDNGSKINTGVDQTPTPTRFIRNCEEVGLFQDLQNVNPFEETFRKANEAGGAGHFKEIESDVLSTTDDTLHTPPFYPNITGQICAPGSVGNRSDSSISQVTEVESNKDLNNKKSEYLTEAIPVSQHDKQTEPEINIHSEKDNDGRVISSETATASGQLETNDPSYQCQSESHITPHPSASESSNLSLEPTATNYNQKQTALENTKLVLRKTLLNQKRPRAPSNESAPLHKVSKTSGEPPRVSRIDKKNADDLLRVKQFRERNREAAFRCREKRKRYIEGLEAKIKVLYSAVSIRESEIRQMKGELQRCRALLLKHRDCSVTQAENQAVSEIPDQVSAPLSNPEAICQKISNPVAQVITIQKKILSSSDVSKLSRNTSVKLPLPRLPAKASSTVTSAAGRAKPVAKSNSGASGSGRDGTSDSNAISAVSGMPPVIPMIVQNQHVLKAPRADNSREMFIVMPVREPTSLDGPGIIIINKINGIGKAEEANMSSQTIQVPEINIVEAGEVPLPIEKTNNPEASLSGAIEAHPAESPSAATIEISSAASSVEVIEARSSAASSVEAIEARSSAASSVEAIEARSSAASSVEVIEARSSAASSVEVIEARSSAASSVEVIEARSSVEVIEARTGNDDDDIIFLTEINQTRPSLLPRDLHRCEACRKNFC